MSSTTTDVAIVKVQMAEIGYGQNPNVLETLLGSCVGVAIWDRTSGLGGLAHVVLPESRDRDGPPGKYADTAVVAMRNQLLKHGANPQKLTAKLAGGSRMFGARGPQDIGQQNYDAVRVRLDQHKIRVVAEHVGGNKGRIIRFALHDGSISVRVGTEIVATI